VVVGTHLPSGAVTGRPEAGPLREALVDVPDDLELIVQLESRRRFMSGEPAEAITVRHVEGRVVSICQAIAVTETLWDVAIDTLEGHRRRGHAAACFEALAAHMATTGGQPVWSADDDNAASLRLAAKLGFRPVERLTVLMPPAPG